VVPRFEVPPKTGPARAPRYGARVDELPEIVVRLSEQERMIVNNTLLMASELGIDDPGFEDRLGRSREDVSLLLDGFRGPQNIARDGRTFRFSVRDLKLLCNAMVEVTNDGELWPGSYSARIGASVAEGLVLLGELEALLKGEQI
jgi:hypothetical protein